MGSPRVAQAPGAVLVAVKDPNLAIDGASGAAVAVGIEGDGLDQVLVAVLEVEVKGGLLFVGGGRNGGGHCRRRVEEEGDRGRAAERRLQKAAEMLVVVVIEGVERRDARSSWW